jgi:outer membrane protein assembly factor BamB
MKQFKDKIIIIFLIILLFCSFGNAYVTKDNIIISLDTEKIVSSTSNVDWWSMFHHDLENTGYSTSTAPDTNSLSWTYIKEEPSVWNPTSISIADGKIYFGTWDNNLYCINAISGQFLWGYETGDMIFSAPAIEYDRVYFGSNDDTFYCLDAETGEYQWSHYTIGSNIVSSPKVANSKVYFGANDHWLWCLDAYTGGLVWNYIADDNIVTSPAIANGRIYFGSDDNKLYCLNDGNGDYLWNYSTGDKIRSSPAVANNKVYFGSDDNKLYCLDAINGDYLWDYPASNKVESCPAVADGKVFFNCENHLYCLNAQNGDEIWSYNANNFLSSSPSIASGNVYIADQIDSVFCFSDHPYNPPDIPSKPDGPISGITQVAYTYSTVSSDPDGDDIYYGWDWNGDDEVDEWSNAISSGETHTTSHIWELNGIYNVKVKAKDEYEGESDWSESLQVEIIAPPLVQTSDVTNIDSTSATFNGVVIDNGGEDCKIKFGYRMINVVEPPPPFYTPWQGPYTSGDTVTADATTGIYPNTRYVVYLIGNNSAGETNGNEEPFETLPNQPPSIPEKPSGPEHGEPGRNYTFNCYAQDNENDKVYFEFTFDGNVSEDDGTKIIVRKKIKIPILYGPYDSNKEVTIEDVNVPKELIVDQHVLISVRATNVRTNINRYFSPYSEGTNMHLSHVPITHKIKGPHSIDPLTTYTFYFSADELDNEKVRYYIDWGDGSREDWMGPYQPGYELELEHYWVKRDSFTIKFKAKDIWGLESDWETHGVSTPKSKDFNRPFLQFFQSNQNLYNLFTRLIQLLKL